MSEANKKVLPLAARFFQPSRKTERYEACDDEVSHRRIGKATPCRHLLRKLIRLYVPFAPPSAYRKRRTIEFDSPRLNQKEKNRASHTEYSVFFGEPSENRQGCTLPTFASQISSIICPFCSAFGVPQKMDYTVRFSSEIKNSIKKTPARGVFLMVSHRRIELRTP